MKHRLTAAAKRIGGTSPTTRLIVIVVALLVIGGAGAAIQLTRDGDSDGYSEADRVAAASAQPADDGVLVTQAIHDVSDSLEGMTPETNGVDLCAGADEPTDPILAEAIAQSGEGDEGEEGGQALKPESPDCVSEEEREEAEREEAEREGAMGPGDPDNPDADSADADGDAEGDGSGGGSFSLLSSGFPGAEVEQKSFGPRPAARSWRAATTA